MASKRFLTSYPCSASSARSPSTPYLSDTVPTTHTQYVLRVCMRPQAVSRDLCFVDSATPRATARRRKASQEASPTHIRICTDDGLPIATWSWTQPDLPADDPT